MSTVRDAAVVLPKASPIEEGESDVILAWSLRPRLRFVFETVLSATSEPVTTHLFDES